MWQGEGFAFDRETIHAVLDESPGVYLLWNAEQWIYVGESQNLRDGLLMHLEGVDRRIAASAPRAFGFERCFSREYALARQRELVRELEPLCNVNHPTVPRLPRHIHGARMHFVHTGIKNRA